MWTIEVRRERIVVVGGSLGGLRAAEQLRAHGWSGEILVVGAEPHFPYNRPPLSKNVLYERELRDTNASELVDRPVVALRRRSIVDDVDWLTGTTIVGADLDRRQLRTHRGDCLSYAGLVIATGLRPRRIDVSGFDADRYVLRTVDDAVALRDRLRPGAKVAVVGGGFIGCEVAASARRIGCSVTVVEPAPAPMIRPLGADLARTLQTFHEDHGVTFRLGRSVAALSPRHTNSEFLGGVVLDDGTEVEADVVVEAIGSQPNVEWLTGNELDLTDGVLCDNAMRVGSRPDVVAVGDVARFPNPRFDRTPRRVEHWCVPTDTAHQAAGSLLHGLSGDAPTTAPEFEPLTSFWSDQFDTRIQGFGRTDIADNIRTLEGTHDSGWRTTGVATGYFRGTELVGVVIAGGTGSQRMRYRSLLESQSRLRSTPIDSTH